MECSLSGTASPGSLVWGARGSEFQSRQVSPRFLGPQGIGKIYGQEKNITTYNLARMNMLLHGVKDSEFEIFHGGTG